MDTRRVTAREMRVWTLMGENNFKSVIFNEIVIFKFYPLKRGFHWNTAYSRSIRELQTLKHS